MTSTSIYDLNLHIAGHGPRPAGALTATIKTSHVTPAHRTASRLAHRPTYALFATVAARKGGGTRRVLTARFLCGGSSENVTPLADTADETLCAKCEKRAAGTPDQWVIYCYRDADDAALYIGQTIDLEARHRSHSTDRRSAGWFDSVVDLEALGTYETRREALAAERAAIAAYRPIHNKQHNSLRLVDGGAA